MYHRFNVECTLTLWCFLVKVVIHITIFVQRNAEFFGKRSLQDRGVKLHMGWCRFDLFTATFPSLFDVDLHAEAS